MGMKKTCRRKDEPEGWDGEEGDRRIYQVQGSK